LKIAKLKEELLEATTYVKLNRIFEYRTKVCEDRQKDVVERRLKRKS